MVEQIQIKQAASQHWNVWQTGKTCQPVVWSGKTS
jgi:hypothetical protein